MDLKFFVYRHENKINGKSYIGITCRKNPNYRWKNGKGYFGQAFYRAIEKYGWDNFNHIIEAKDLNEELAKALEVKLIKLYKLGGICYNVTDGGDGNLGVPMPEVTRQALIKANTGRVCSEETKKKISESEKGKKCSEKNKLLYKLLYTGKSLTLEQKNKIRKNNGRSKPTILVEISTGIEIEFPSAAEASRFLGLGIDSVRNAIRDGYLLKNK